MSLAVVLLAGCFAELNTSDEPDTTSSSQTCTPGAVACACYGNGTCDAGLECIAEISACVPAGCTPGTLQCTCDGALCAQDLECNAGLCVDPDTSSSSSESAGTEGSSSASDPSTSDGPTTTPSTTDNPTTTMPDSSSSSTSESDVESESESESESETDPTTETGNVPCDEMDCGACVMCVAEPGGDCDVEAEACEGVVGCQAAAQCMAICGVEGDCFDDCCGEHSNDAAMAATVLDTCREDACAVPCGEYHDALCT